MYHRMVDAIPHILEDGLIAVDSEGIVQLYNEKAADILGLFPGNSPDHPRGTLENNDIVLLATNKLGCDDGDLTPQDLQTMGLDTEEIQTGDMLVAIGIADAETGKGIYKRREGSASLETLDLSYNLDSVPLHLGVYPRQKMVRIQVHQATFDLTYSYCACNLVILDGRSKTIKFYQSRGYSVRNEEARAILSGSPYSGKGSYAKVPELLQRHITQIHGTSPLIESLVATARGEKPRMSRVHGSINNIPLRCSIIPMQENTEVLGALLQIWDMNQFRQIEQDGKQVLDSVRGGEQDTREEIQQDDAFAPIIGSSQKMRSIIHMAERAAASDSTVLILGESGTGKGLLAEAIHKASPRSQNPFVVVECASIPENLLESELFGYEKGAFTGALGEGKPGRFAIAQGGTVFLDEIGELPVYLQAKLLHVLQKREFFPLGGLEVSKLDVRIIAATNRDLMKAVETGEFREDLYYRLNIIPIDIPPLRERPEDIYPLKDVLIPKICNRLGKKPKKVSREAMQVLLHYPWRGNVRELENILERAINMVSGDYIFPEHFPDHLAKERTSTLLQNNMDWAMELKGSGPLKSIVEAAEKAAIQKALEVAGGSRRKAMAILEIGKTNFYKKLKKYGINP